MGDLGVEPFSQNLQLLIYDSPGGSTDQRFGVLPNYLGHLLSAFAATINTGT